MSVCMEYTSGTFAPAQSSANGTLLNKSVMMTQRTFLRSGCSLTGVFPDCLLIPASSSPVAANRFQTCQTNPAPGESVNVPGKFARWYRGIFVASVFESTVHSSTCHPACSSSTAYSLHRAATPPAPLMSVVDGTRRRIMPPCDDDVAVCVSNDALVVALVVTRAFFFEADADAGMFARIGCSAYQLPVELAGTNRSRKRTRGGTHRGLQISPRV